MSGGSDLSFACDCGQVRGRLCDITQASGSQLRCHCADCRRAVLWLDQPDPGDGGICYYQTDPARVVFDAGDDKLAVFKWRNGRLMRWYTTCCNTPLFNTLDSPKWAFASLAVARLATPEALGPCTAEAFVTKPNGKTGHVKAGGFMWGFLKRVTTARITGRWRETPFFDATGAPIAAPKFLTSADRARVPKF